MNTIKVSTNYSSNSPSSAILAPNTTGPEVAEWSLSVPFSLKHLCVCDLLERASYLFPMAVSN